jgi:competence protein CoiA
MGNLTVIIRTAPTSCWSCGAETTIISSLLLTRAEDEAECAVADFTEYPALIDEVKRAISDRNDVGEVKPRPSKTLARAYMSNGCYHCDALFGQHFEIHTRYHELDAARLIVPASGQWAEIFRRLLVAEDGHLFQF